MNLGTKYERLDKNEMDLICIAMYVFTYNSTHLKIGKNYDYGKLVFIHIDHIIIYLNHLYNLINSSGQVADTPVQFYFSQKQSQYGPDLPAKNNIKLDKDWGYLYDNEEVIWDLVTKLVRR